MNSNKRKKKQKKSAPPIIHEPIMTSRNQNTMGYAICSQRCEAKLLTCAPTSSDLDEDARIIIEVGTLLQIKSEMPSESVCTVKLCDFYDQNLACDTNLYLCSMLRLYQVQSDVIWPFVIAILDPLERLKFVQNYSACNFIQTLKVGSLVNASGLAFNKEVFYDCIVRFIGLVDEMGPGYYFGLELLVNYFFFLYFFFLFI
jgi:hypothetical protein